MLPDASTVRRPFPRLTFTRGRASVLACLLAGLLAAWLSTTAAGAGNGTLHKMFLNPVVNSIVRALGVQHDGKVESGGNFTAIDGQTQQSVARLNTIVPLGGELPDVFVASGNSNVILRINPNTGEQTNVSSGGSLTGPTGLDVGPDGNLYVATFSNSILRIDPNDGAQTIITSGGSLS